MIKKLLAATAFATTTVLAAGAVAQNAPATQLPDTTPSMTTPSTTEMFFTVPGSDLTSNALLASRLIGQPVYDSQTEGAQELGQIKDLIVAEDGSVEAIIVGVGGFLGVGQKDVAINFENLSWSVATATDGTTAEEPRLFVAVTSDELNAAPAFDTAAFADMQPTTTGMTPDDTAMAPATGTTATDPNAAIGTDVASDPNAASAPGAATDMGTSAGTDLAAQMPDPATLTDVDPATISADDLIGTTVYSAENENVGEVGDVILSQDGMIDAVVLDIGGFLGIGQKPVAIAFEGLGVRRDENGSLYVYTAFSRTQLENAPDYVQDRYPNERDSMRLTAG